VDTSGRVNGEGEGGEIRLMYFIYILVWKQNNKAIEIVLSVGEGDDGKDESKQGVL
jgi:hypothetical protein